MWGSEEESEEGNMSKRKSGREREEKRSKM